MARISKYGFDQDVTTDDFVIGSDSQTKATKNYKLETILDMFVNNIGISPEQIEAMLNRIAEVESQFVLTNGDITGLNLSEPLYRDADRRADLEFNTNTFAADRENLNNELLYYFDFNHNLDKYPSITVTESGSPEQFCIVPVKYINTNTVRVYFKAKTSGKVHAN
jgi:hypothetical protein